MSEPGNMPGGPQTRRESGTLAPRLVATGVGVVGAAAVFVWALHAVRVESWWQLGLALVVWVLHALLVARVWRER